MEEKEMDKLPSIDLSKVKNLEAIEKTDSEFASSFKKNATSSKRKSNKNKFSFVEPIPFELPSKGRFYQDSDDEDLKKGIVNLIPMSIAEEEILANRAYLKNGSTSRILFNTCMASDYPAGRLLSYDSMFLMYALRNISYGGDYSFKVRCDECGHEFDFNLNIEEIEFEDLKEEFDSREIKLPISKYTISMHLLRLEDEENIVKVKNRYKEREDITDTMIGIYVRTDYIKDNKGNELDEDDYMDFLSCLPARDRMAISESFKNAVNNPMVDMVCPKCGNDIKMGIPWNESFFRPS